MADDVFRKCSIAVVKQQPLDALLNAYVQVMFPTG